MLDCLLLIIVNQLIRVFLLFYHKNILIIISKEIRIEEKQGVRKKYLKFKISNLFKRYIIVKNKKYLKNNIDFENLTKLSSPYPSKYKNLIRLKLDEKKIIKKNKKIIFTGKSNLVIKIFDLK